MTLHARHMSVAGDSGSGKTTLLREINAEEDGLSIFINYDGGHLSNVSGKRVRGYEAMQNAVRSCSTVAEVRGLTFNYIASSMERAVETAARFCRDVANHFGPEAVPMQILVDESQRILHDGQSLDEEADGLDRYPNLLWWVLHEGRDLNIRAVAATQDPMNWNYSPIKNCVHRVWCGEWAVEHKGYLNYFEFDRSELPTENFEYVVFDKRSNPVERGETKARYG
jgi:hypothetical protein